MGTAFPKALFPHSHNRSRIRLRPIGRTRRFCRTIAALIIFFCPLPAILGCGGGGGGSNGHAPAISNLTYSPTSAIVNDGSGSITITGSFYFTDDGGDISSIRITTYDSSGSITNDASSPIPGASGVIAGTLYGQVLIGTSPADVYKFQIRIVDSQGAASNVLSGLFPITYPPSANPVVLQPGYSISSVTTGLGAADGVTIGPTGDIFLVDNQGGRVLRVDVNTHAVTVYATGIPFPGDLAFDTLDRLFVPSSTGPNSIIYQVFPDQTIGVFSSGYSYPTSIEAAPDGSLFVANSGDGTIAKINSVGVPQNYLSGFSSPNGPFGLSLDGSGNIYFADHGTGRIYKSSPSRTVSLLATFSPLGPTFTGVDKSGAVYVADPSTASIYKIASSSVTLFASGFTGKSLPPVIGPTGLAFDGAGNLFVSDGDRLWKITSN